MTDTFSTVLLFQVKPDKLEQFEGLLLTIKAEQGMHPACLDMKLMKRFFTFDDVKRQGR